MRIYCSGIGGIGLSAYAALMHKQGHDVYGSDRAESPLLDDLRTQGITITLNQSGSDIPKGTDFFVYSEAIPKDAPERQEASHRGITHKSYPEAVGDMTRGKKLIAICGSHGKSSTTAMVAKVLSDLGIDPTVIVGTKLAEFSGRNWREGKSEWFVLEACEYRRSFLHYSPQIILMTNADVDHLDYYTSQDDYRTAFTEFVSRLPDKGLLITHMRDTECRRISEESGKVTRDADAYPMITLKTPGTHMQSNAQLVLALCDFLALDKAKVQHSLSAFAGTWRRMEIKGTLKDDVLLIDDYAHHPVEIQATLKALKEAHKGRRLVVVFQPHTHDRTIKLYDDFVKAFSDADLVLVPNVYDARHDIETKTVSVSTFVDDIAKGSSVEAIDGKSLVESQALLQTKILKPHDVLVTMGAGDITNLAAVMTKNQ